MKNTSNTNSIYIYCDLDGVLADLVKHCYELLPAHDARRYINKLGKSFWSDVPWVKDGKRLWNYLSRNFSNVSIVATIPPRRYCKYAARGKSEWIDRELGRDVIRYMGTARDKLKYCTSSCILIDDYTSTVQKWRDMGGFGIVHTSASDTIRQLNAYLKQYFKGLSKARY